jgi:hypothetical protein
MLRRYAPVLALFLVVTVVWLVVAIWVVFFGGPQSSHSHRIDQSVIPGLSVGGIALGDSRSSVVDTFGPDGGASHVRYDVGLLDVAYDARNHVAAVATSSPRLKTPSGVGVGATLAAIRDAYAGARCSAGSCVLLLLGTHTRFDTCGDAVVRIVEVARQGASAGASCSRARALANTS